MKPSLSKRKTFFSRGLHCFRSPTTTKDASANTSKRCLKPRKPSLELSICRLAATATKYCWNSSNFHWSKWNINCDKWFNPKSNNSTNHLRKRDQSVQISTIASKTNFKRRQPRWKHELYIIRRTNSSSICLFSRLKSCLKGLNLLSWCKYQIKNTITKVAKIL